MTQATTKRTGVAILLQPYLLISHCASQYCFALRFWLSIRRGVASNTG